MLKKRWNTLQNKQRAKGKGLKPFSAFRLLPFALCLLFLFSCAPKYAEKPSREGLSLVDIMAKMNKVKSVEAVLSIDYEKNDATMSGDAHLDLAPTALDLRIYYLGFLYGELTEDNGVIRSKPKMDKNKIIVLVDGLKNSFLWWTIKDYTVQEKKDSYVLTNSNRTLIIGKKDLLPLEQIIELDNGDELFISYDTPVRSEYENTKSTAVDPEISWYQSHLSIRYKNHQIKVKVKSYMASTQKSA